MPCALVKGGHVIRAVSGHVKLCQGHVSASVDVSGLKTLDENVNRIFS